MSLVSVAPPAYLPDDPPRTPIRLAAPEAPTKPAEPLRLVDRRGDGG